MLFLRKLLEDILQQNEGKTKKEKYRIQEAGEFNTER